MKGRGSKTGSAFCSVGTLLDRIALLPLISAGGTNGGSDFSEVRFQLGSWMTNFAMRYICMLKESFVRLQATWTWPYDIGSLKEKWHYSTWLSNEGSIEHSVKDPHTMEDQLIIHWFCRTNCDNMSRNFSLLALHCNKVWQGPQFCL